MNFNGPLKNLHDTITIQSTKKGVNPFELTPSLYGGAEGDRTPVSGVRGQS